MRHLLATSTAYRLLLVAGCFGVNPALIFTFLEGKTKYSGLHGNKHPEN
jgi:hypothetical protein